MSGDKEVFHVETNNGYVLVDFVRYERDSTTNKISLLVVNYCGRDHNLTWNEYDFRYEGEVDYQKGYVL